MNIKKPSREREYKTDGNKVLYFNGVKWLIKETFKTTLAAKNLFDELKINPPIK